MCSKILLTELTVIFQYICFQLFILFKYLLTKMNSNTCIKTEPTTMEDYEIEVNIYIINMISLLTIVFVKCFIFGETEGAP